MLIPRRRHHHGDAAFFMSGSLPGHRLGFFASSCLQGAKRQGFPLRHALYRRSAPLLSLRPK